MAVPSVEGAFVVRTQSVGGGDLLAVAEEGRKETPWIGVGSLFVAGTVVEGWSVGSLWVVVEVENQWLEVVGKRVVVVGFGRMVVAGLVVVGKIETVLYWGSWLDRYDE